MQEIPMKLKMRLMEFAKRLPESRRARFLIETSRQIADFAADFLAEHNRTVIYGAVGYVVGKTLDSVLVLTLPCCGPVCLTMNLGGVLLGTAGLGYGFLKDQEAARLRTIIVRQIRKALQ